LTRAEAGHTVADEQNLYRTYTALHEEGERAWQRSRSPSR
jgi:hypothetical protein